METEINLRPYFVTLKRRWLWIVIGTVVAALVAATITYFFSDMFEATALVIVTEPTDVVQFDERFRTLVETHPLRALPELAKSDEVLTLLAEDPPLPFINVLNIDKLQNMLTAEPGSDASLIRLSAQANNPENAAALANAWADEFVTLANELFRDQGGEQVTFFEERLSEATIELTKAENALIDFEAINRANILDTSLIAYAQYQTDYLVAQKDAILLLQDVVRLKTQLEQNSVDASFSEDLTVLILQLKSYNAQTNGPFLIELSTPDSLIGSSPAAQRQQIDHLITSLEVQLVFFSERLEELDSLILDLQRERQEYVNERIRLTRDFEIAQGTYTSLGHKLEEERITSQDTSSGLQLASRAVPPNSPVGPSPINAAAVAALFGFILTVLALLATEWLQSENVKE